MEQPTLQQKPSAVGYIFLALSLIGLGDASYLFANFLAGESDICTVTEGCNVVLTSEYAAILGVPLSFIGLVFYAVLFILSLSFLTTARRAYLKIAVLLVFLGFLASIRFVYLQVVVLNSICEFCMVSAALSTILSIVGVANILKERKVKKVSKEGDLITSSHE